MVGGGASGRCKCHYKFHGVYPPCDGVSWAVWAHSTITRGTPDAGCWLLRLDTELQILHSYPASSRSPGYCYNELGEQVSAVMGSNKTGPRRHLLPCPLTPPCYDTKENFCELCLPFYNSSRITFVNKLPSWQTYLDFSNLLLGLQSIIFEHHTQMDKGDCKTILMAVWCHWIFHSIVKNER